MRLRVTTVVWIIATNLSFAQFSNEVPEVGKPMPAFKLNDVTHYKSNKASYKDFKGKWLFLDFWTTTCIACINSFESVNQHQKEFKDKLNWVMVGITRGKYNKDIKSLYEKIRLKKGLEMISAYDSILSEKWEVRSVPHIVIVNPEGMVHSIVSGRDFTTERIRALLNGETVKFYPKGGDEASNFDANSVLSETGAGVNDENILSHSLLTKWNGEQQTSALELDIWINSTPAEKEKGQSFSMTALADLYNFAFIGRSNWIFLDTAFYGYYTNRIVIEVKDPSPFEYDYNFDVGKGTYNYSFRMPGELSTLENIKQRIQQDLKSAFGYDASLETRAVPAWKLVAKQGVAQKLKSKGGPKYVTPGSSAAGFSFKNYDVKFLVNCIEFLCSDRQPIFVDETGIDGNIDFSLDADMTSIPDIQRALRLQGLDLILGTHEMKVVVIRDPKSAIN